MKNDKGNFYYINKQLPEAYVEWDLEIRAKMKEIKKKEEGLANDKKTKMEVRSGVLYLNGSLVKKEIVPPSTQELFLKNNEKRKMEEMHFVASDVFGVKGSQFTPYAVKVNNLGEVRRAYAKSRRLHPYCHHVTEAYMLGPGNSGFQDDEEHSAGWRILEIM